MNNVQLEFFMKINDLFEDITSISGKCKPHMSKYEKKEIIRKNLEEI